MKCVEVYKNLYHQEPYGVAFCPYRISPLGAHIDHQYGKINGLAIDKGIHMAYHPKQNGVVELQSLNFPKRAQFFASAVPDEKQGDWADHLRGAAKILGEKYRLKVGLSGIIEGSLPIGGLSSSASVIICFLSALCKVNGIHLEPMEMILTAKAAENQYVGVSCGKLDQSCEVLSKKNHLLYLDTKDDSYELIPTSEKMKPYKVAIFFSGLERSLKNSKYNLRQDECKAAAYALMGYAGMDYDTFANTRLRDVPYEVFETYKDRLPELWRRRAEHYYSEFARAEKGAELWRKGDLDGYGQLVFESGKSSIYSYECGCDELKKLYEIMTDTDGIYGGRFSGAGFKGCCMALIDPDKAEDIEAKVASEYLKAFPALEGILYIYGCYMKERGKLLTNTVVTTVMSNFGLYKAFDEKGIGYAKTAVGDKYVYEYMAKNGCRIGGEQSGHIIFSKYASTGDGILTSLKMMEVMLAKKVPMSKLAEPLKIYPQVLENVRVTDKKAAQNDPAVQEAVKAVAEALGDTGRILVRESGTEPVVRVMVEAPDHDTCQKYVSQVVDTIKINGYGV